MVKRWRKLKERCVAAEKPSAIEALKTDMPKLVEEAWRYEESNAFAALRYSRTDYACQKLGELILARLEGK